MQSSVSVNAKFGLPIRYQCSKCGTTVDAFIPVSGLGTANRQGYVNSAAECDMIAKARTDAREMVESNVKNIYKKDAAYHCQNIIGQCSQCSNLEAWQKDLKKVAKMDKLVSILAKAVLWIALIGAVIVGASANNFWFGALTFVAVIALYILLLLLYDKVSNKKEINKNPIGFMNKAGVPEASRPQYTLTLEEILPRMDTDIRYS